MTDHATPLNRIAPARVCVEQPDWRLELLTALCSVLVVGLLFVFVQLGTITDELITASGERDTWIELALAPDRRPAVRLEYDGRQFTCRNFNVRHEWQVAVAAECRVLGELLRIAGEPR